MTDYLPEQEDNKQEYDVIPLQSSAKAARPVATSTAVGDTMQAGLFMPD